jgi:xanthine/uracil permease
VANIVFSLCATVGALLIAIPSAVKGRWAVAIVFGLLAAGFLLRARAGYRRGEWR